MRSRCRISNQALWLAAFCLACAGNGAPEAPPVGEAPASASAVRVVPLEPLPPASPIPPEDSGQAASEPAAPPARRLVAAGRGVGTTEAGRGGGEAGAGDGAGMVPEPPAASAGDDAGAVGPSESHAADRRYRAQLASRQDRREAIQILDRVRETFSELLDGLPADVQRIDIDQRGTWYRVLVGEFRTSRRTRQLCRQLQDRGQDCVVLPVGD